MPDQLFKTHAATHQSFDGDALIFEERNPLDQTLLREIEAELAAVTGCTKKDRARLQVCTTSEWNAIVAKHVPKRLHEQGMVKHFRVLKDPADPHHLWISPTALSGLNEGHKGVITDLVHQIIEATGRSSNQAFDRGVADALAAEISRRLDLPVPTGIYPTHQKFVETIIEAVRGVNEDPGTLMGLLKRSPNEFFARISDSSFYKWWEDSARSNDQLSRYVDLIASITSPSSQLEGSFMAWAEQCATIYVDYRAQQRRNAQAGAAKRADN